jgi:hypothetical protein
MRGEDRGDLATMKPPKPTVPPCPRCGRKGQPANPEGSLFRCGQCGAFYDSAPDEGGDWSDRNPAARLERPKTTRAKA